ncbi:hypothetical protein [Leptolyngbya sp. FACHB-711]|uniref:hypothetical protein n=1 Tax=unclassified Leptolyngbya TaxID=2650499 RepID=UPI001684CEF8|nr:hypothetical protein [Leptolyngbya sp. FACHB-711]MBD1852071.1 hypothetical protein [Cyanobacteria bacterium FACHB-502]MBD2026559.1 hypothetical protein [Leptolyngbya sp. FACHB-711]
MAESFKCNRDYPKKKFQIVTRASADEQAHEENSALAPEKPVVHDAEPDEQEGRLQIVDEANSEFQVSQLQR